MTCPLIWPSILAAALGGFILGYLYATRRIK